MEREIRGNPLWVREWSHPDFDHTEKLRELLLVVEKATSAVLAAVEGPLVDGLADQEIKQIFAQKYAHVMKTYPINRKSIATTPYSHYLLQIGDEQRSDYLKYLMPTVTNWDEVTFTSFREE